MSFFSILLFASAIYFVHGRPEPITTVAAESELSSENPTIIPGNDSVPYFNDGERQEQVDGLLKDMMKAMDTHMIPLMAPLNNDTQEQLLAMAINGFSSYLNYVMMVIQEDESKNAMADAPVDKVLDKDDIIVEFDELLPMSNSGLITAAPIPDSSNENYTEPAVEVPSEEVPDSSSSSDTEEAAEDYANAKAMSEYE